MPKFNFRFLIFSFLSIIFVYWIFAKEEIMILGTIDKPLKIELAEDVVNLFPKNKEDIKNLVDDFVKIVNSKIIFINNLKEDQLNFKNVMKTFDDIREFIRHKNVILETVESLSEDEKLRDEAHNVSIKIIEFEIENVLQNKKLYQILKNYTEKFSFKENLNEEQKYFIKKVLNDFKKSGFNLSDSEQKNIQKIKEKIDELESDFNKAINDDVKYLHFSESDLKGLDKKFIESLPIKEENGIVARTLDTSYPVVDQILANCSVEKTRKVVWTAFVNRAYPQNISVLEDLINSRDLLSKKLGYKNYADLDIEDEVAKNSKNVENFLKKIDEKILKKATQEVDRYIKDLPKDVILTKDNKIKPWDWRYIKESYRKKYYNLDQNLIAEYFPIEHVLKSLFEICGEFFSLNFEEVKVQNFWNKDVKLIKVYKKNHENFIGWIILDLFPRPGKYTGASQSTISPAYKIGNENIPGIVSIIANFPKPTSEHDSLLLFDDVSTLFHEFGHVLHSLLNETSLKSFAEAYAQIDFIETPSQFLEEWIWDKNILKKISKHYKTDESLSNDIIDKILLLKNFDIGNDLRYQIMLSLLSLEYFKGGKKDIFKIKIDFEKHFQSYLEIRYENHSQASFGHLSDYYGSKYYSYLWSKIYAIDLFYFVQKYGLDNQKIGKEYINKILTKGGSQDSLELLKTFLGREPNINVFFENIGL